MKNNVSFVTVAGFSLALFCSAGLRADAQKVRTAGRENVVRRLAAPTPTPTPMRTTVPAPTPQAAIECKECGRAVAVLETGAVYSIAVDISKAMPKEKPQIVGLILTGAKNQNKAFTVPLGYSFAPGPNPATSPGEEFEIMVQVTVRAPHNKDIWTTWSSRLVEAVAQKKLKAYSFIKAPHEVKGQSIPVTVITALTPKDLREKLNLFGPQK
jgi:hypothetical protein